MTNPRAEASPGATLGMLGRVWRSIFPQPIVPDDERGRLRTVRETFVLHLRPVRVRRSTLRYSHTFGLGGSSLVLITLMIATGVLMMFVYEPSPERAYQSVTNLEGGLLFGGLVRNVHHWSANLLVAVVVLHMLRVFLTGAYHGPRRFNWIVGLALLAGVLAANFTGYLLPWDQLSYWAVTICTAMLGYVPWFGDWLQRIARGGTDVGPKTLIIFYALHTSVLPVMLALLMGFHFWRVRKAGGVIDPSPSTEIKKGDQEYAPTLPNLLVREFVVALALCALIATLGVFFDAPLGAPANPGMSTNPAKAPWYFVGFQELQLHFHPLVSVVVVPGLLVFGLLAIPYLRYSEVQSGPWFLSSNGRRTAAVAAIAALVATPVLVLIDEFVLQPGSGLPSLVGRGIVPLVVLGAGAAGLRLLCVRRFRSSPSETVQALFVFFAVMLAVLTITGAWFRGPGMALAWPWTAT